MNHETTCKVCHKPISIEVDDDYAATGDPHKLLPLATCNACYDLRDMHRSSTEGIARVCGQLQQWSLICGSKPVPAAAAGIMRHSLEELTKRYCSWLAASEQQLVPWEYGIVEAMMRQPQDWAAILRRLQPRAPTPVNQYPDA